jgi:hypothetical protein
MVRINLPGGTMRALQELLTTDVGLLSLGVIVFMLGMGGFYLYYFLHHMHTDESQARRERAAR